MSLRPFLIALQFLTRLPVRLSRAPEPAELGQSLLWYPAVGLLLGALLCGLAALLQPFAPLLRSAVILASWVALTGALHLDGLADCADAWIGGRGDRERTLAIMKDPYAGPVAVAAVVMVLLLKFAALAAVPTPGAKALLLAPVLARCAIPALFASTPYVRTQGLGSALSAQLSRNVSWGVVAAVSIAVILVFRFQGLLVLLAAAAVLGLLRYLFLQRLGGITGDCAGAAIELIETAVLIVAAMSI